MIRVCVVCEGLTEVEFINRCLGPHLQAFNLLTYPSIIRAKSGCNRGGCVSIPRLVNQIHWEYFEYDRVTTLVDFYGFQDKGNLSRLELERLILDGVSNKIQRFDPRFVLPYIQLHEFEGLLFSDIEGFDWVLDGWSPRAYQKLLEVRNAFSSPEDINDGRETAPSKRIQAIFGNRSYSKTEHGPLIAESIGLERIRQQCPCFNEWVGRLEAWGIDETTT